MKELSNSKADVLRTKTIDEIVKNKFRFSWLDDSVDIKTKKGDNVTVLIGDSIVKVDVPGKVNCKFCSHLINYGIRGKVAITDHLKSAKHIKEVEHRRSNYTLGGEFKPTQKAPALFPLFKVKQPLGLDLHPNPNLLSPSATPAQSKQPERIIPISRQDCKYGMYDSIIHGRKQFILHSCSTASEFN